MQFWNISRYTKLVTTEARASYLVLDSGFSIKTIKQ